jgi:hypothetical protein
MLPVNVDAYCTYIYDDPQNPAEYLVAYRTDVFAVHTAGLGWAALLAMAAGAVVMWPSPPARHHGPRVLAKSIVAALYGLLLAAVNLAVVLPRAGSYLAFPRSCWGDSAALHPLSLRDWPVLTVVLCAAVNVSLFAAIGVGLAAMVRRGWLVLVLVGMLSLASLVFMMKDRSFAAGLSVVSMLVASPLGALWYLTLSGAAPLGVALTLAVAVGTTLLGSARYIR